MKKLLLCVVMVALSVSAAFGGATEDLFEAAHDKDTTPQKIQSLIESGANVNAKSNGGWTPLMQAAYNNSNPEVVKALINAGADINAKDKNGIEAVAYAQHNENPEIRGLFKVLEFSG